MGKKRFAHILGVAEEAELLARTYGVDARKARLAGLLHDWDKGLDDEGIRARVRELGIEGEVSSWALEMAPAVLHGETAACALSREWPQIPSDVIDAIRKHTVADEEMTDLDKVVYIADALEPNRQFGRLDELRDMVGRASLDELFFETYKYWVQLIIERGRLLHPDTITRYNAFATQHASKKGASA